MFGMLGNIAGSAISSAANVGIQKMVNDSNERIAKWANDTNLQMTRENNQANKELSELAYHQNIAQWNLENEYNSPSAQMQRYKDAGLNPNLIYGQQNLSASSPQMRYERQEAGHVTPWQRQRANVDISFGDVFQSLIQMLTLKNQLRKSTADASLAEYQADIAKNEAKIKESDATFRNDYNTKNLMEMDGRIANLAEQKNNLIQDYENKKVTHSQLLQGLHTIELQQQNLRVQKRLTEEQIRKTHFEGSITENNAAWTEYQNSIAFLNAYQDLQIKKILTKIRNSEAISAEEKAFIDEYNNRVPHSDWPEYPNAGTSTIGEYVRHVRGLYGTPGSWLLGK